MDDNSRHSFLKNFEAAFGLLFIFSNPPNAQPITRPPMVFEGEKTGITYQLVEQGIGIAFYPTLLSAERIQKINMAKLKIVEPKCSRTVGLVWNKNRIQSEMLKHFIQFTETYLRNRYK